MVDTSERRQRPVLLLVSVLIPLMLASCCGFLYWDFTAPFSLEIVNVSGPPLTLDFKASRMNCIMGASFYSDTHKEYLWIVDYTAFGPTSGLTYGIVPERDPSGRGSQPRQRLPKKGPPRPLKPGETVILMVGIQYDRGLSPLGGGRLWQLEIQPDGTAKVEPLPQGYMFPSGPPEDQLNDDFP